MKLEDMSKEDLVLELKKLQSEVFHLKMGRRFNVPEGTFPDGYAYSANLPDTRSGQIPSSQDLTYVGPCPSAGINNVVQKIEEDKVKSEEVDRREYSGWCLRITDFEGLKFLFLKSPDGRQVSIPVDSSPVVEGRVNRPQTLYQFANVLGTRDIPGVWPRWWKVETTPDAFIIERGGMTYTISPPTPEEYNLFWDFFTHLNKVRVKSIDLLDGA